MQIVALDRSFYKLYRQDIVCLSPQACERLRLVKGFERLREKGIPGEEAAEILGKSPTRACDDNPPHATFNLSTRRSSSLTLSQRS